VADVRLTGVEKAYGDIRILHGIDLEIRDGEFMVFVGPSGCGKSTLLRSIAGLEEITGGTLSIGGRVVNDVPPAERGIAMVFQSYALYPHMNLFDNMAFGLKLAKVPKAEIETAVRDAARILHIEHLLDRKPKDLSGGQRQRVAIGRAIVRKPNVFLFDEPLSNLDAALRVRMRYEFAKLHEDLKTTMIYVTHDQVEAMTLADRIVVLSAGKIEQVGSPLELYEHPRNLFVAGFIGSPKMNFLDGELVAIAAGHVDLRLAGSGVVLRALVDGSAARVGDKVTLGVRPEHIRQGGDGNLLQSTVAFVESLGGVTFAYCPYPGLEEPLTCQFEGRNGCDRLRSGQALDLHLPAEALYVFDAEGRALRRLAAPELQA
jgi:multiple sugar transport system ATP-binding protein